MPLVGYLYFCRTFQKVKLSKALKRHHQSEPPRLVNALHLKGATACATLGGGDGVGESTMYWKIPVGVAASLPDALWIRLHYEARQIRTKIKLSAFLLSSEPPSDDFPTPDADRADDAEPLAEPNRKPKRTVSRTALMTTMMTHSIPLSISSLWL